MQSLKTLLIIVVILCSFGCWASADDAQTIARKTLPSVVFIVTKDANDQPIASGSGFFVQPGLIATNWHVISDGAKITFSISGQQTLYGAVVKAKDLEHDVALLKIVDDVKVASLSLGDGSALQIGQKIYAVGNPEGFEGTFSEGLVSGLRVMDGMRKIQISAPISHGSSGGPLVNERGEVVGITSQIVATAQNLNFAVPIGYIKALLFDPELQKYYEEGLRNDYIFTSRSNHGLIDFFRKAIADGTIKEIPGGVSAWHSRYDPHDPQAQTAYEELMRRGVVIPGSETFDLAESLIKQHAIRRVRRRQSVDVRR